MAIVMYARHDPDASPVLVVGFTALAAVFLTLAVLVYRPLLQPAPPPVRQPGEWAAR